MEFNKIMKNRTIKPKILIVDDSPINRTLLSNILGEEYEIIEAENGAEAIAILENFGIEITLVFLDIYMPKIDGFGVLEVMREKHWSDNIPVIIISSDDSGEHIEKAYEMGVTDFIGRQFDAAVVKRRATNTIMLYSKQKLLEDMVANQIYEKEKNSNMLVNILSHIVEFRNGESGLHIIHVKIFTEILLKTLVSITDKYKLSSEEISIISIASALHDIGKISIPDAVLNKPGKFTDEEFKIMKTHSKAGAEILEQLTLYKNEPLVKTAYEICRWHHERFDGRGYPDGLKGDDIPISAQVVAMADVYDALTSERCYKKAFSHEKAVEMILNGECGEFNPILKECLKSSAGNIKNELVHISSAGSPEAKMPEITPEILSRGELSSFKRVMCMLGCEREKNKFVSDFCNDIIFEYKLDPSILTLSAFGAERLGLDKSIVNPLEEPAVINRIKATHNTRKDFKEYLSEDKETITEYKCDIIFGNETKPAKVILKKLYSFDNKPKYIGVVGKIIEL